MTQEQFHVSVSGDDLVFSAAHFITLGQGLCERLHGHNYRVSAEVYGPLGAEGYVVDFVAVRKLLTDLLARLDHRVMLPAEHSEIRVAQMADETTVRFASRRWVFPTDDCVVLPVSNTTAEQVAAYLARQLHGAVATTLGVRPTRLVLKIDECAGLAAVCELAE